ncbi:SRR1-like protein [Venturia canescens]|uniref:SRR1-like protein n=1 Tax=Venturia canescens TaxID=32260 RepID=UPI001C9BC1F3|nr:SRR1-like protein [Venturia canescens]
MSDVDEYKVVTRRRKSNRFFRGVHRLTVASKEERIEDPDIDLERVRRGILAAVNFIEESNYKDILFQGLDEALRLIKAPDLPDIICYGLGNFSQSRAPKFQLAAVLAIKSRYRSIVYAYDPLFFKPELEILKELGIQTIDTNEEAKRTIEDRTSLVYMPHCPYQLTNNFIYANWAAKNLLNCLVLSNSFGELVDSVFSKNIEHSTNYIDRISPYTTEIKLKNNFEYEEVFNGSSIHIFSQENIDKVPTEFWDCRKAPIYQDENCEFVRSSNLSVNLQS